MEYGKFNSAEELLKGYTELEKSFTQKCQELSAIKQMIQEQTTSGTSESSSPQSVVSNDNSTTSGTSEISPPPTELLAQSTADDVTVPLPASADGNTGSNAAAPTSTPPRVMTGGGNVSMALPNRPKTLREASELAKKYFN